MLKFQDKLRKHFRIVRHDCNPYLASPPRATARKDGRKILSELLADLEVKDAVEIGTRKGKSALVWLMNNPDMNLTCIDPWLPYAKAKHQVRQDRHYENAVKVLSEYKNTNILRMVSMEGIKHFKDESLDFVHIDGNHEFDYCCPDIIYWSHKLRKGGIMVVHDYCSYHWNGVMEAVNAYTHCHQINPWYVTRDKTPSVFWEKP
jgi:predicted O-methyltransferase YrrM